MICERLSWDRRESEPAYTVQHLLRILNDEEIWSVVPYMRGKYENEREKWSNEQPGHGTLPIWSKVFHFSTIKFHQQKFVQGVHEKKKIMSLERKPLQW